MCTQTQINYRRCLQIFVRFDFSVAVVCVILLAILSGANFCDGFNSDQSPEANEYYKNGTLFLLAAGLLLSWEIFIYHFVIGAMEANHYSRFLNWFCYQLLGLGFTLGSILGNKPDDPVNLTISLLGIIYGAMELWTAKKFMELLRSQAGELLKSEMV